jgi:plastocyanin
MFRHYLAIAGVLLGAASATSATSQHMISQKGRLFSPGALSVKVGDTVVFKNDDTVTHHIYSSTKGHEFNLATAPPGQDVSHALAKKGRVDVRCGLHPGMRMVVTVQ